MKKLFITIVIVVVTGGLFNLKAQTVNDVPLKDINVEYVEIVGTSKLMSSKVTIQIDFGQQTQFFSKTKQMQLKDADGQLIEFNSMIDALNFMSKNGYEFESAYAISTGSVNVYHYLLRKEEMAEEAAIE